MNEFIEKIKNQINIILDMKIGDTTVKDSLSQVDSRASAIPIAAIITVFLFLVMQALVSSNEFDFSFNPFRSINRKNPSPGTTQIYFCQTIICK